VMDRSKSSRNGVHNANGLVWEPVWIDRPIDRSGFYRRDRRAYHLHEETARLADPAGGAEDGDLVPARLGHRAGDGAGRARGAEEGGHGEEDVRCGWGRRFAARMEKDPRRPVLATLHVFDARERDRNLASR